MLCMSVAFDMHVFRASYYMHCCNAKHASIYRYLPKTPPFGKLKLASKISNNGRGSPFLFLQ